MLSDVAIFLVSLVALLLASDSLVEAVIELAKKLQVSTMVIGLTVVSIGTSLPELSSSIIAAYQGHPAIAMGNVLGSNICNIALILGLPGLFVVIRTGRGVLHREGAFMLAITFLFWFLAIQQKAFDALTGVLFLALFFVFILLVFRGAKKEQLGAQAAEVGREPSHGVFQVPAPLRILGAFIILLVSSDFLVSSTVAIAAYLNVSESIIALTLIAFGTSVPELSVSFSAARKKEGDILIGNILGSNISNILLVIGISALIVPVPVESAMLVLDFPAVAFLSVMLVYFLYSEKGITRSRALLFLACYGGVVVRGFL